MNTINNGSRRAVEYLVYGALPPHSTTVLWMDTSNPELPVLKIFWNGCWTPVHTDESKEIDMLVKAIEELTESYKEQEDTIASQQETIAQLTEGLPEDIQEAVNQILNKKEAVDLTTGIPAISYLGKDSIISDGDANECIDTSIVIPEIIKVGDVFKASEYDTSLNYKLAKIANDEVGFEASGSSVYITGITEWITEINPEKEYIVTNVIFLNPGVIFLYEEYDVTNDGLAKKIQEARDSVLNKLEQMSASMEEMTEDISAIKTALNI